MEVDWYAGGHRDTRWLWCCIRYACMYKVATLKFDTFQDEAHLFMVYISSPFWCYDTIPQATLSQTVTHWLITLNWLVERYGKII